MEQRIAITVSDAVKVTGMSRSALYEALRRGDLTARKAGRRTLIQFSELEAYLDALPAYERRA